MERSGVLPSTQFAYRKGLGTCDALMCVPCTAECIGEWAGGSDCEIDFSGQSAGETFETKCKIYTNE